ETDLAAYAHQDVPFERVVEEVNPPRSLARHPLYQVALVLQNTATADAEGFVGLDTTVMPVGTGGAKFDLAAAFTETHGADGAPGGIQAFLEYATDLFDADGAERLLARLIALLDAVTADPDRPIGLADILTREERRRILHDWNGTAAERPADRLTHEMVAAHATGTPDATAVVHQGRPLSYAELDTRANRLAHRLAAVGAGPGTVVGVCLEGPEAVVALLAVLKAGAACVPLGPADPDERRQAILADAAAPVVVTRQNLGRLFGAQTRALLVDDPAEQAALAAMPGTAPAVTVGLRDAAYVLYTSGSAATPKGVVVEHRGLLDLCLWHNKHHAVTPEDRASLLAPPGSDAAVWELWPYLCAGASVHLPDPDTVDDPAALAQWCAA